MGYRIEYESVGIIRKNKKINWSGLFAVICIAVLVIGAVTLKTAALPWIQEVLLPGDPDVTAAALEGMVNDLRDGDSIGQAVRTFCEEIMKHAQILE